MGEGSERSRTPAGSDNEVQATAPNAVQGTGHVPDADMGDVANKSNAKPGATDSELTDEQFKLRVQGMENALREAAARGLGAPHP